MCVNSMWTYSDWVIVTCGELIPINQCDDLS